jgi:hypothetical protein
MVLQVEIIVYYTILYNTPFRKITRKKRKLLDVFGWLLTSRRSSCNSISYKDCCMFIRTMIARFYLNSKTFFHLFLYVFLYSAAAGLLLPFIYYKFLTFRYASRRNPYSRYCFKTYIIYVRFN